MYGHVALASNDSTAGFTHLNVFCVIKYGKILFK